MTGATYEYLGSDVHLYQERYLKKGPGLGIQENYMPPMPTAPQTLKTQLAHRGTHTNKTTEEHTEGDQLTNHQRDHFKGHNSHEGQIHCWCLSTHVELCHGSGPVSWQIPCSLQLCNNPETSLKVHCYTQSVPPHLPHKVLQASTVEKRQKKLGSS